VIVCKDCGHKNQNQTTFCEACGTFLEWAGESVLTGQHQAIPAPGVPVEEAPPAPPPAAEPVPAAPPVSFEVAPPPPSEPPPAEPPPGATGAAFQAQRLPVIQAPDAAPEPPAPAPPAAAPPPTPAPAAAAPPEEPKAPAAARPGTQVLRAMRMKARPPAPPPAPPAGPTARPPAEEHERRPPKPPSAEPPRPQGNAGDIYCSSCGTPNDPTRHYCRSCGAQLGAAADAPVAPATRVPWWRRIFGRGAATSAPAPAGTRPAAGKGKRGAGRTAMGAGGGAINSVAHVARRFFQAVAILGALGIAVVAIGPWRSEARSHVTGWVDDVRRIVQPHYSKVTPSKISASSALKNNPPQNAFDGIIETFWAEGARGDGTGQSLTVTFAKPTDLARIGLTVGDQATPQAFATRPVPHTLALVFYDANGAVVKRETVTLEQTPKFQKRDADAKGVTRVVITIGSTYPPVKGTKSAASIAEVELFTKD
jgi:hypothetical protein